MDDLKCSFCGDSDADLAISPPIVYPDPRESYDLFGTIIEYDDIEVHAYICKECAKDVIKTLTK